MVRKRDGGTNKKGKQPAKKQRRLPPVKKDKGELSSLDDSDEDLTLDASQRPTRRTTRKTKGAKATKATKEKSPPGDEEMATQGEGAEAAAEEPGDASPGSETSGAGEVEGEIYLHIFHMLFMFS